MDNEQELLDSVTVGGELPYKGNTQYGVPKVMVFFKQYLRDGENKEEVAQNLYETTKDKLPKWAKDMEEMLLGSKEESAEQSYTKAKFDKAVEKIQIEADEKYAELLKRAKEKIIELQTKLDKFTEN